MPASKHTIEEKIKIVQAMEQGKSKQRLAEKHQVSIKTLHCWKEKYYRLGVEGFEASTLPVKYPKVFQDIVIREYLNGEISISALAKKYDISNETRIHGWLMRYNNETLSNPTEAGAPPMTQTRQTTMAERVRMVKYYEANDVSYSVLAKEFNVSYQQARNIVQKFERFGVAGLDDRRGKRKAASERTDAEVLTEKIKALEAKNKELEVENAFLKKLDELGRS